jgi:hypothetical protein
VGRLADRTRGKAMTRTSARTLSSVVLALAALQSTAARGDNLYSPPFGAGVGTKIQCAISNLGTTSATVTIRGYRTSTAYAETAPAVSIGPGGANIFEVQCHGTCDRVRCDFYTNEKTSQFRASACLQGLPDGGTICLPAQ